MLDRIQDRRRHG